MYPGTVLGTGDKWETRQNLFPLGTYILEGEIDSQAVNKRIPQVMSEIKAMEIIKQMIAWRLCND